MNNGLFNLTSELIVLSAFMRDEEARDYYSYVNEDHFYYEENKLIYNAIATIWQDRSPVSRGTVLAQIERWNALDLVDMEYLYKLEGYNFPRNHVDSCVKDLEGCRYTRVVLEGGRMFCKAIESGEPIDLSLKEFNNALSDSRTWEDDDSFKDIFADLFDEYSTDTKIDKFLTGISCIDKVTGGFARGELVTIGAKSGVGKSTLSLRIALNIFKRDDVKILLISREMSKRQIGERILSTHSGIDKATFENKTFDENDWQRLVQVMEYYSSENFVVDTRCKTVEDVKRRVAKFKPDILIVDYLQLMTPLDGKVSRERQIADISRELKNLTLDFNMVVIQLSQLAEKGIGNYRPSGESHIRESRAPYHDSNIVIYIHEPSEQAELKQFLKSSSIEERRRMQLEEFESYKDHAREECGLRHQEIIVDKNRNGDTTRASYVVDMKRAFYAKF